MGGGSVDASVLCSGAVCTVYQAGYSDTGVEAGLGVVDESRSERVVVSGLVRMAPTSVEGH